MCLLVVVSERVVRVTSSVVVTWWSFKELYDCFLLVFCESECPLASCLAERRTVIAKFSA